jgi:hypothetical protein
MFSGVGTGSSISGKSSFSGFMGFEQGDQPALAHWLDHQTIAVTVHDRLITWQFKFHRNADCLVSAIAEQSDVPVLTHEPPASIC